MGAMADAFAAFAEPLLNHTDGSIEQLNKALAISQLCYNLALLPETEREPAILDMREHLPMDDEEFEEFRVSIILPMIQRHEEMFPGLHGGRAFRAPAAGAPARPTLRSMPPVAAPAKTTVTDRYAACPCNSGKKYKFCCGSKRR